MWPDWFCRALNMEIHPVNRSMGSSTNDMPQPFPGHTAPHNCRNLDLYFRVPFRVDHHLRGRARVIRDHRDTGW